jgi:hypothetical protein
LLKTELKIFENLYCWEKNKYRTLFKNNFDLENYQNYFLKKLSNNKQKLEPIWLKSSGTTTNQPRLYKFPNKFYKTIENHHIWRIMDSHKITPGNVIKILQGLPPLSTNKLEGPSIVPSMGLMNKTWQLIFNPTEVDDNFWKKTMTDIKKLKPKFLYTSPSVFVSLKHKMKENFQFPIIFSCEILTDVLRKEANLYFEKSIDKMMDWPTGFGFFECEEGTKHIYDEFCIAKQKEKKITCINLFNYCEKEIEKTSDDAGILKQKVCSCGTYGNYLEEFKGKIFECLVSIKGTKYSSNFISNIFCSLSFELGQYEILQKKNKSIEFKIKKTIDNFQIKEISILLNNLIGDFDKNFYFSVLRDNDILFLSNSDLYIKFIFENPKIHNNKIISVRSHAF